MAKEIVFNNDAREQLRKGVDALANAVKVTLGTEGYLNCISQCINTFAKLFASVVIENYFFCHS